MSAGAWRWLAVVVAGCLAPLAAAGGEVVIPVGYEGSYAYLSAPLEGVGDALFAWRGVVRIGQRDAELTVTLPGHAPLRFVPAGRQRFHAPATDAVLTFVVRGQRVESAQLDGHHEATMVPVTRWQAALVRLGRQLGLNGAATPRLTH